MRGEFVASGHPSPSSHPPRSRVAQILPQWACACPGYECYFLKGAVNGSGSRRASRLKVEEHYVVSVLPVSSLFLRASQDELRLGKGETADRNRLIGPVSLQETNLTDYIPSILI